MGSARRARGGVRLLLGAALGVVLLAALVAAGGYLWLQQQYQGAGPLDTAARVQVEAGASLRAVLTRLQQQGALRSARATLAWLRLRGQPVRVQTGTYEIAAHASPADIVTLFEQGKVVLEQLTVVEGATFAEFFTALEAHPDVQHTLSGKTAAQ